MTLNLLNQCEKQESPQPLLDADRRMKDATDLDREWRNSVVLHELVNLQACAIVEWLRFQWGVRDELDLNAIVLHAKNHIMLLSCQHAVFCKYTDELKKSIIEILDRALWGESDAYYTMLGELNDLFC